MQFGESGETTVEAVGWFLPHDNAPSHTSLVCAAGPRREKLSCHHPTAVFSGSSSEWLLAVPYSEGTRFSTTEDIKSNAIVELQKVEKEASRRCFQQWQGRWNNWVRAQEADFLGD
jgi:hypothetical protein